MLLSSVKQGLVIVGGGPAGLAPLFAAASVGRLEEVLRQGVTVLERGDTLGSGALGEYGIRSDSAARAFLDIVMRSKEPALLELRSHPVTAALEKLGEGSAPLALVSEFLRLAGTTLCGRIANSKRGRVLTAVIATAIYQAPGGWRVRYVRVGSGSECEIESKNVLLASGAHQPLDRLMEECVAGAPLLPVYTEKLLQSGDVLASGGPARVTSRLSGRSAPKVVIVGGSTSAGAVAVSLLNQPELGLKECGLTIMHRSPLRIFYESVGDAMAEGYTEFSRGDVCPITGRVYRLGGFRLESRELIMSARGIGGRLEEPRVGLFALRPERYALARHMMDRADLIIVAMGYRPRLLPIFDINMRKVRLSPLAPQRWSVVDERCRVTNSDGTPLPGIFALGLAIGPAASKDLGGEVDFRGQVNSLWMWQHTLGLRIVDEVLSGRSEGHVAVAERLDSRGLSFAEDGQAAPRTLFRLRSAS